MSINLEKIFNSDGLHRRVIKHNKNYATISACTESILTGFLPLSGGTLTGPLYGTEISATTFYSGSTDLSYIFAPYVASISGGTGDITRLQDGVNTFTGGTENEPNVNVTGLSIDNITVSGESSFQGLSATTLYSGNTDLSEIFAPFGSSGSGGTGDVTRVQSGINVFTGGTDNYPTVNLTGLSVDNISVSGDAYFNVISATTIIQNGNEIGGVISSDLEPSVDFSGSTWIRTTDYESFIYDSIRGKWLGVGTENVSGSRNRANQSNVFLRHFNGTPFNLTPFRAPYDLTIVNVVADSRDVESWKGMILTGDTASIDSVYYLDIVSSNYFADNSVDVDILSGSSVYLYMSGSSISYPRVDVYFKRRS